MERSSKPIISALKFVSNSIKVASFNGSLKTAMLRVTRQTTTPRTQNRGADLMAALLRAQGVEQIMGLTGGAIMEGMDALQSNDQLRMHIFQTEPGAAWAAMGYARATGKPGVCVVTSGPAATNTITPIADAQRDNVPLLVITGQVPTAARNTDAFQETDITAIAAPTAKKVFYLNRPQDMPTVVAEAFHIARSGRPGPVLIDLTKDAQQAPVNLQDYRQYLQASPVPPIRHSVNGAMVSGFSDADLEQVAVYLRQAKQPVMIAGYGVVLAQAQPILQQLLDVAACPMVHTLPGKAALPKSHPCNYGMLGMHGFYVANWMVQHADLIISLGSRFDDRITGDVSQFAPNAVRLIHFDIDAEQIDKVLPARKLGIIGNLKDSLTALHERLQHTPLNYVTWHDAIATIETQYPSTYLHKPEQLQAQHAIEVLSDVIRQQLQTTERQVIYSAEVGDHQMWTGQYMDMQPGWQFLTSSGQGAMGSGLPMAIGAQLANPAALVIAITGDGSLRFSEAELETIIEYDLPVKIVLVNNSGYGIVRMWNHRFYEGRETGVIKHVKDWTLLARSNGFTPQMVDRISTTDELQAVFRRALSHRHPHFIELVTPYEECLPIMPPGKSFHDIILA
jgi:acetolactate synthase-1/2/3 large subunit